MSNFSIFLLQVGSKSTRVKSGLAPYLLQFKSMQGLGQSPSLAQSDAMTPLLFRKINFVSLEVIWALDVGCFQQKLQMEGMKKECTVTVMETTVTQVNNQSH